ncbi:cyclic nucleotide-binding protein [Halobiforma lacisalsi AJ5]|uniref:Cyclic nucleotide-binding protein n=1 Tax=Natronobacterium lacisalsi AJ5 TaxID=358396 RepID=M0LFB3_NATLA|nr:cupin domain-containing protein [Halobiforma lacisalsi]APW98757.1 cyclic nucleotide-binding protein [Halobiforma lacisalsi AJ5]EMA32246.1 cyclic nucleotide-binding protein [Halobiforma lacisalsi AJ5]
MYSMVDLENVEPHELDDIEPTLLPIGPELRPDRMRPSVWEYDAGEENTSHRQDEQEELYVVLEGTVDVTIEHGDDRDVVELTSGDVLVVSPESWRQIRAIEESRVLVVGAPNVADDAIVEDR